MNSLYKREIIKCKYRLYKQKDNVKAYKIMKQKQKLKDLSKYE